MNTSSTNADELWKRYRELLHYATLAKLLDETANSEVQPYVIAAEGEAFRDDGK